MVRTFVPVRWVSWRHIILGLCFFKTEKTRDRFWGEFKPLTFQNIIFSGLDIVSQSMHNNYRKYAEHKKNFVCHAIYSIYKSERVKLNIKEKLNKWKTEHTNKHFFCKNPAKNFSKGW